MDTVPLPPVYRQRPARSLPSFDMGQSSNPYLSHYTRAFAFSGILDPLDNCASLTVCLLWQQPENPSGFCSSECVRCVRVGFRLYSGGRVTYRLTEKRAAKPPTYLLVSVCQPDFTDWY